jgi:intracellular sulfur oxidation DsrE/DsrF family protein
MVTAPSGACIYCSAMSHHDDSPVQRRGFVARLAAALAAATAALTPTSAIGQASERVPAGRGAPVRHEEDKWLDALNGVHKQVYDVVTPAGGIGIAFARNFLTANADGYGLTDKDLSVVVSFRHSGIAFAFDDAFWQTAKLGDVFDVRDAQSGEVASKNPQRDLIVALQKRGVVFTVCGMALRRRATEAAQRSGAAPDAVRQQWRAGLLPGVIEVAAGVVAVNRTQERGFSYVYAG